MAKREIPTVHGIEVWNVEIAIEAELGERPVWDESEGCLVWVDITAGQIHKYRPGGKDELLVELDVSVGSVGLCKGGGYVAACGDGFRILDDFGRTIVGPIKPPDMGAGIAFNDGACDPAGRFWAGTTATDGRKGVGALYYFESNGDIVKAIDGVSESNGIAWSPDGTKMYYVDSGEAGASVRAYDFDVESARLGTQQRLVTPCAQDGIPDGLVVDSQGCLWVAFWGGSSLRRYSPIGEELEVYRLPVTNPTCPGFGGADLRTLFLTSAWEGMTESSRLAEPYAGSVLSTNMAVSGLPSLLFG